MCVVLVENYEVMLVVLYVVFELLVDLCVCWVLVKVGGFWLLNFVK